MKTIFTLWAAVFLAATALSQVPEKMSYQAVIRNSSGELVQNSQVGMRISILQGSSSGTPLYSETHITTTNSNGLVTLQIGDGNSTDDISLINWKGGPFYVKTETDPAGGTNYTITATSQLLSVPFALYAKTAENVTGGISETDPVFSAWDRSTGISIKESQVTDLKGYLITETDPEFGASVASGITNEDTMRWNNKLDGFEESDPLFGSSLASGITQADTAAWNAASVGSYVETDPIFESSFAAGINDEDTAYWNHKMDSISGDDPMFDGWDKDYGDDFQGDYNQLFNRPGIIDSIAENAVLLYSDQVIEGTKHYVNKIMVPEPIDPEDATSKSYVDSLTVEGRWSISGNAGTNPDTDFIGTTDNQPIAFRVNNSEKMRLHTNANLSFSGTGESIFIGKGAGSSDDRVNHKNVFIGDSAGFSNTTGTFNTVNGYRALYTQTMGNANSIYGYMASSYQQSGNRNSVFGTGALQMCLIATENTAMGYQSLYRTNTAQYNTAMGYQTLYGFGSQKVYNTAIGYQALHNFSTGKYNTVCGALAMYNGEGGQNNTASGYRALYNNWGDHNTAGGVESLSANTSGNYNTASGSFTLNDNTTGSFNTGKGYAALSSNTSGDENTAVGSWALSLNKTGNRNTAVGRDAGPYSNSQSNTTTLGYQAHTTTSNSIRLGDDNIIQIGGIVGWSNLSDGRFKTNVLQNIPGLDFIMKLRPVTFNWDLQGLEKFQGSNGAESPKSDILEKARKDKEKKVYTGFIAQEVEKAAVDCGYDFSGIIRPTTPKSTYHLSYAEFVVPLVKALQEQQNQIEAQQQQINEQLKVNEQQQQLIDELLKEIESLR